LELLNSTTFVTITFKNQKNTVKGKAVSLGCIGKGQLCPAQAAVNLGLLPMAKHCLIPLWTRFTTPMGARKNCHQCRHHHHDMFLLV
jgi:hypothetical protein